MSAPVRWTGRLSGLAPDELRSLLSRAQTDAGEQELCAQVASILAEVAERSIASRADLGENRGHLGAELLLPGVGLRAR